MAVGRPISLTPNIATKTISIVATAGQTSFTPAGGYRINEINVYRNGVRLVQGSDFVARDGATVELVSGATVNDVIDFQIFDSFNVVAAVDPNNAVDLGGSLTVTGSGTSITGVDIYATGSLDVTTNTNIGGIVTATEFYGSGVNLTGVSGFATALSTVQTSSLNKIFKTPKVLEVGAGTSIQVDSDATSGYLAFTRESRIVVSTGATFAVGSGTTLITNVLDIF